MEDLFLELQLRREGFLQKLRSKGKGYKRYSGSPLRYAGGKSWAVGYVIEWLPFVSRVVSLFFGGGSIEIAIAKELGIKIIGFDVFDLLVNYWKMQIEKPIELYNELSGLRPDKETYDRVKRELKRCWEGEISLEPLKLATYFFFNHNLSYGPGFLGWMSSVYANERTYRRMILRVRDFSVKNIEINCASFEKVIPEFKDDFLLCDPPYYLGEGSLFRGLYPQRNFPVFHDNFRHELLHKLLMQHRGGFILFYNNVPTIRNWYRDFRIIELPVRYTMGQGETRIGRNRRSRNGNHTKRETELMIIKFPNGSNLTKKNKLIL